MLAATDDGTVWAWGDGKYGKLGKYQFDCGFEFYFMSNVFTISCFDSCMLFNGKKSDNVLDEWCVFYVYEEHGT